MTAGFVTGGVKTLMRLEGLCLLAASVGLYAQASADWQLFAILFLAPDLVFAAYLGGPRQGAIAYNAAHSVIGPLALGATGILAGTPLAQSLALIWIAHVGFDRALGFGLKYASGFSDTHLGRTGRKR